MPPVSVNQQGMPAIPAHHLARMRFLPPRLPAGTRIVSAGRRGAVAAFAFSARSLQQVSTLAITLLAARYLAPADYGIYSLGVVFVILVQTLTFTGFYQFILTAREDDAGVLSTCFWLILGTVSAASAAMALGASAVEQALHAPRLASVLVLFALVQPLASVGAWSSAALLRRGAVTLNTAIVFTQNLVALVGGAALLWAWQSLYALVAFRYLRVVTGAGLYALFARDRPALAFSPALARRALAFSGGLYGARGLDFLARYGADLMLGMLHSPAAVGLYRFGNRVATGATDTLAQPMAIFAATQFGAAARNDQPLDAVLARFAGSIALLCGLVGATIIVVADIAVPLLFDPAYTAALAVTYAMAIRGAAGLGQVLIEPAFAAAGRTGWVMMFNFASAAMAILALLATAPWGLAALAWGQVLVVLTSSAGAFALLGWRAGIAVGPAVRNYGGALAIAGLYGLALWIVRHVVIAPLHAPPVLALLAVLGVATCVSCLALIGANRLGILRFDAFAG